METYRQIFSELTQEVIGVVRLSDSVSIPFDSMNTDYQAFKTQVLEGATLEDPDGVVMTQEEADAFIATLP